MKYSAHPDMYSNMWSDSDPNINSGDMLTCLSVKFHVTHRMVPPYILSFALTNFSETQHHVWHKSWHVILFFSYDIYNVIYINVFWHIFSRVSWRSHGKKHATYTGTTMTVDLRYCELQYFDICLMRSLWSLGLGSPKIAIYLIIFWSFFGHRPWPWLHNGIPMVNRAGAQWIT